MTSQYSNLLKDVEQMFADAMTSMGLVKALIFSRELIELITKTTA